MFNQLLIQFNDFTNELTDSRIHNQDMRNVNQQKYEALIQSFIECTRHQTEYQLESEELAIFKSFLNLYDQLMCENSHSSCNSY